MRSKRIYVFLSLVPVLMLMGGVSLNGKALAANHNPAQPGLAANQRVSLALQPNVSQSPATYSGYTRVNDNEDKITLQIPVEWNDIETGEWTYKGRKVGVFVAASGDLGNFYASRSQAGVLIGVSHALAHGYSQAGLLDLEKREHAGACVYKGRFDFQNMFYLGQYDQFNNCANGTPNLLVLTTASADQKSLIMLRMVVVSQADLEAVDKILSSFQVLGDPEVDDHHDE